MDAIFHRHNGHDVGRGREVPVRTLEELLRELTRRRAAGETIVFTNGCFDLLHVGHVQLLEEASRLGDVLVVAVNSDASVRRLKGTTRPIVGQADRAAMLAAIACVDYVVIFDEDTPHRLLAAIRPDVLVKGGRVVKVLRRGGEPGKTGCGGSRRAKKMSVRDLLRASRERFFAVGAYRERGEWKGDWARAA